MKYAFIQHHRMVWPVRIMCRVMQVSHSGFYDWMRRIPSRREQENRILKIGQVPSQDERFALVMKSLMKEAPSWSDIADNEYPKIPSSIPTQVIYGEKDWSPKYALKQNQKRLPKHVRFQAIKNTGHFSFLDNPSASARIIQAN